MPAGRHLAAFDPCLPAACACLYLGSTGGPAGAEKIAGECEANVALNIWLWEEEEYA